VLPNVFCLPLQFLEEAETSDYAYAMYTSNANPQSLQTAIVSPLLDVSQISELNVTFDWVLNGEGIGSLCE
jgi:hypothetical protein